jgi:hypothetical protein
VLRWHSLLAAAAAAAAKASIATLRPIANNTITSNIKVRQSLDTHGIHVYVLTSAVAMQTCSRRV